jgi:hypothetical protein
MRLTLDDLWEDESMVFILSFSLLSYAREYAILTFSVASQVGVRWKLRFCHLIFQFVMNFSIISYCLFLLVVVGGSRAYFFPADLCVCH